MKQSMIPSVRSCESESDEQGKDNSDLLSFFAKIRTFY